MSEIEGDHGNLNWAVKIAMSYSGGVTVEAEANLQPQLKHRRHICLGELWYARLNIP